MYKNKPLSLIETRVKKILAAIMKRVWKRDFFIGHTNFKCDRSEVEERKRVHRTKLTIATI